MTTEDDFQSTLDANPKDWQTRLVFADWLQERNDPRADGYRALGTLRIAPIPQDRRGASEEDVRHWRWSFHWDHDDVWARRRAEEARYTHVLPESWVTTVSSTGRGRDISAATRRETEDLAALAFAKLPADRRAELLAMPPAQPKSKAAKRPKRKRKK